MNACKIDASFVLRACFQGNPFWRAVRDVLKTPGKSQIECQKPKPILLDTGEMKVPYDWAVSSGHGNT